MRKYAIVSGLLAAGAGTAGFLLRRSELIRGFEPDTGLPASGAVSTAALIAYTVFILAAAAAASAAVKTRFKAKNTYKEAFAPSGKHLIFTAAVCAAALVSGALLYIESQGSEELRVQTALAALTAVSGIALFGLAADSLSERESKLSFVCAVVPEIFFTLWLLLLYRSNQTNPVRIEYAFQALAAASAALASYFTASFVYGRSSPVRAVFFHIAAVYFLGTAAADGAALSQKIVFIAFSAYFAVNLGRIVGGLEAVSPRHLQGSVEKTT
ncbi:MAG: hypothetical protein LBD49_05920 [Oscillospiraceae bacterium]|jgi:hypothetical protein|nr:hypothetical protein [Oscillospiraceae bacterium]